MGLLAYARKDKLPDWIYPLEAHELFYLPQMPALQLYPVPNEVYMKAVKSRAGVCPQVVMEYRQGKKQQEGVVAWDRGYFVPVSPRPAAGGSWASDLNRIEARLFEGRACRESLQELTAFAERVRASRLSAEDKTELLLEVFYHQALCYRQLGQSRRAAVTLSALWRGDPQSDWGQLAKQWLIFRR
jgi:hypothetical protein